MSVVARDLNRLAGQEHDLLIIGGGIYGACVAWDAVLRGLSVALVERGDFGHATSANSLKIVHGGLRYLQSCDFTRMRESIGERATLMRIAPHLVHPMPCLMPTYGHGARGREAMALALMLNDLISADRNCLPDPQKYLPNGRTISATECLQLIPGIPAEGLTGGAIWYDGQMHNSERLTLSFVLSAARKGADVANYAEVTGFLRRGDRVTGALVRDHIAGQDYEVRARAVVNASGPWVEHVLGRVGPRRPRLGVRFAKAINLVSRQLVSTYAVAVSVRGSRGQSAHGNGSGRALFVTPWRGRSLIGTHYTPHVDDADSLRVDPADVESLIAQVNSAWPSLDLESKDVLFVHNGLVPVAGGIPGSASPRRAGRYQIVDHRPDGMNGLFSIVGVKYTTARDVAEKTVHRVLRSLGYPAIRSTSAITPLHGGQIEEFDTYLRDAIRRHSGNLGQELVLRLVYNYGSSYLEVLRQVGGAPDNGDQLSEDLAVLRAQILYGIREEMAQKLADLVFRRTDLGSIGEVARETLGFCADVSGAELGWSKARREQELAEVRNMFHLHTRQQVPA